MINLEQQAAELQFRLDQIKAENKRNWESARKAWDRYEKIKTEIREYCRKEIAECKENAESADNKTKARYSGMEVAYENVIEFTICQ